MTTAQQRPGRKRRMPSRFQSTNSDSQHDTLPGLVNCDALETSMVSLLHAAAHTPVDSEDTYGSNTQKIVVVDIGSTKIEAGWAIEKAAPITAVNNIPFRGALGRPWLPARVQYDETTPTAFGWEVDEKRDFCKNPKVAFWGDNVYNIDPDKDCHIPPQLSAWDVCKDIMGYVHQNAMDEYLKRYYPGPPLSAVLVVPESLEESGRKALLRACREAGMTIKAPVIDEHAAAALGGLALSPFEVGYVMGIDAGGWSTDVQIIDIRRSAVDGKSFLVVPYGRSFSVKAGGLRIDERFTALLRKKYPTMDLTTVEQATQHFSTGQKTVWPKLCSLHNSITNPPTWEELSREVFEPEFATIIETVRMALEDFGRRKDEDQKIYEFMKKKSEHLLNDLLAAANGTKGEHRIAILVQAQKIQDERLPAIEDQLNRLEAGLRILLMGGLGQSPALLEAIRNMKNLQGLKHELNTPSVQNAHGVFHGACLAVNNLARFVTVKASHTYALWGYNNIEGVPDIWKRRKVYDDGHTGAKTVLSPEVIWEQDESVIVGRSRYILGKVSEPGEQPTFPRYFHLRRAKAGPDAPPHSWRDVMILDMAPMHKPNHLLKSSISDDQGVDKKKYKVLEYQLHLVYEDYQVLRFYVTDPAGTIFKLGSVVLVDF